MLFDLWNKFESRLPLDLYQRKLVEMGDFLASIKVPYLYIIFSRINHYEVSP